MFRCASTASKEESCASCKGTQRRHSPQPGAPRKVQRVPGPGGSGMGGGRQAAAELRRERRERGGASTGEDSRGGRQGTIKASAAHLSRHRARGRESWCGSSSGSGTRADRPPAHTHARWQERVRRCPCPALGDREKGWSQVPSSHRGQPAEPPAVPRPGEPSARRRRRGGGGGGRGGGGGAAPHCPPLAGRGRAGSRGAP